MSAAENPSAFPNQPLGSDGLPTWEASAGMTLRDWFAGQALVGLISGSVGNQALGDDHPDNNAGFAHVSYLMADAMLAERAKAVQP